MVVSTRIAGPLVLDLDGTLIRCTSFRRELKDVLIRMGPVWTILNGIKERAFSKAKFKLFISDVAGNLSYVGCIRWEIVKLVNLHLSNGGEVLVASAASPRSVRTVLEAADLSLPVIASTAEQNMKGNRKAQAITQRLAGAKFTYIGDSVADIPVFNASAAAYLVSPRLSVAILARLNPRTKIQHLSLGKENCEHD
jgi:phosphoserine phosphatase